MQLEAFANALLPKLAWVAKVDQLRGFVTLQHGAGVEVRPMFFIEGVWNAPFQKGEFGDTDCVFGTGGILTEESIRFVSSASTTDYLYYVAEGKHVMVSNSLPLLLASVEDALNTRYEEYALICHSILDGINDYRRDIPTKRGMVRRLMYRNLDVSRDHLSERDKLMPPRFACFKEYRDYLRDRYALIATNARDGARKQPLEIVSTQSKGYDSTAVNAIAAPHGINKVFTVSHAKSNSHLAHHELDTLPDDDGGDICAVFGIPCIRLNRQAFVEEFDDEYLYYCALHLTQDANLKDIRNHVSQVSLLLTGTLGEIWYPRSTLGAKAFLDEDLRRWDLGGHGMAEWRLVVGLIHLPMPYIGARRKPDIVAITESFEMDPWRMGRAYDRPIPRRIAEEAGIPRDAFGQSKMGSVVLFSAPSIPYGQALRREFFQSLADERILSRFAARLWPVVRWVNSMLLLKSSSRFAGVYYTERLVAKLIGRDFHFSLLWSHLEGALFCFCVNRTAKAYSQHLSVLNNAE